MQFFNVLCSGIIANGIHSIPLRRHFTDEVFMMLLLYILIMKNINISIKDNVNKVSFKLFNANENIHTILYIHKKSKK